MMLQILVHGTTNNDKGTTLFPISMFTSLLYFELKLYGNFLGLEKYAN